MIGKTIGQYTIEEKIGQGGMGVVYRATDGRLRKSVVLKFLPEETARDETARRRLLREARAAAQLDHPYICHVYEVGEFEGADFIAMEYVSGQTLQEQLKGGLLPVEECLRIASEIAEALDKAQQKGIVHRDLKPANIMLTDEGHVKVMDFGLAKRIDRQEGDLEEVTRQLTQEGAVVGTIPYMSPEQLKGEALDSRSDIFSFGVLLYEMLAGLHPFRKSDPMATVSAILQEEPTPVGLQREGMSPIVQHMARKMLAKDPSKRYLSAREIYTDLVAVIQDSGPGTTVAPPAKSLWWSVPLWLVVPIVLLAIVGTWALKPILRSGNVASIEAFRSRIPLPPGKRALYPRAGAPVAISPNGRLLAFVAGQVEPFEPPQIYIQHLTEWSARKIDGTEWASSLTFSPDSQWIAFGLGQGFGQGVVNYKRGGDQFGLKRVRISGQGLETICATCQTFGRPVWSDEDRIFFSSAEGSKIFVVPASGGESAQVLSNEDDDLARILTPFPLPQGKGLLFARVLNQDAGEEDRRQRVDVTQLLVGDGEQPRTLIEKAVDARYVDTGHIVFAREGTLWAIRFDLKTLQTRGDSIPVLEGVSQSANTRGNSLETRVAHFSLSHRGKMAYLAGGIYPDRKFEPVWVTRAGDVEPIGVPPGGYVAPRILSNHQFLLSDVFAKELYVWDMDRKQRLPLRIDGGWATVPGPREGEITYRPWRGGVYKRQIDGDPASEVLLIPDAASFQGFPIDWTPDGETLLLAGSGSIWTLRNGQREHFLETPLRGYYDLSPDGKWFVYSSLETGRHEVYLRPFPGPGGAIPISVGYSPVWTPDGQEVVYRRGPEEFWTVQLKISDDQVTPSQPLPLFRQELFGPLSLRNFDTARDGRVIGNRYADEDDFVEQVYPTEIRLIENWVQTLEEKFRESN